MIIPQRSCKVLWLCLIANLIWAPLLFADSPEEPLKYKVVEILKDDEPVGAGFFITNKGYILTARHVIDKWPYNVNVKMRHERNL